MGGHRRKPEWRVAREYVCLRTVMGGAAIMREVGKGIIQREVAGRRWRAGVRIGVIACTCEANTFRSI